MTGRLAAYLARLGLGSGLDAAPSATPEGLALMQAAHRQAITFENIDVLLGRGIRIGSDDVFAKLVERGRGGYCFEQNRLFADMLAAIGITNRPLLARPRLAMPEGYVPPRTHVLLLCKLEGQHWIADAGFGGSYVPPLPLEDGATTGTGDGAQHRLRHIARPDGEWVLERSGPVATTDGRHRADESWQAQYTFDLAHVEQDDLEMSNHWAATYPKSRFVLGPIISRVLPAGFVSLNGAQLSIASGGEAEKRQLGTNAQWRTALAEQLGLHLSAEEVAALGLFAS